MNGTRQVLTLLQGVLLLLYAPAAFAASAVVFGSTLTDMPLQAWALLFVLSTIAGVSTLLRRLRDELIALERTGEQLRRPALYVTSHLLLSWLGGLVLFLLSVAGGLPDALSVLDVIAGSWLGVRVLDRFAESRLPGGAAPAPAPAEAAP